jgi:hypothetical protein
MYFYGGAGDDNNLQESYGSYQTNSSALAAINYKSKRLT